MFFIKGVVDKNYVMIEHLWEAIVLSILLILVSTAIFYEILSLTLIVIAKYHLHQRLLMLLLVVAIFSANIIAIFVYAVAYWGAVNWLGFEQLSGFDPTEFFGYIYFSAATYSSLGIGDIFPHGAAQLITGVEVLNGLILIGWSATFTYFSVQKLWDFHGIVPINGKRD